MPTFPFEASGPLDPPPEYLMLREEKPVLYADGEQLDVRERVIVAPAIGVFRPLVEHLHDTAPHGIPIEQGAVVGVIESSGRQLPVRSPFAGRLMEMMAFVGERVYEGQPVAWLRVD